MSNLKIHIDQAACVAHGDCVEAAPGVFAVDDVAHVIGTDDDDVLFAAADSCPSAAIILFDAQTDEQVYP
ncbi:MAG: ferredoxin [Solirubrobacteraceae bacterium]